jgi:hypothetical protein
MQALPTIFSQSQAAGARGRGGARHVRLAEDSGHSTVGAGLQGGLGTAHGDGDGEEEVVFNPAHANANAKAFSIINTDEEEEDGAGVGSP